MDNITRQNIIIYITKIRLNFDNAYNVSCEEEFDLLVESWYDALKEYPKDVCDNAVNEALKKAKFAPRLGNITEEIEKILSSNDKTDEELWVELTSVLGRVYEISRYLKYPQYVVWAKQKIKEIYDKLDKRLQLYLVNHNALIELSELSAENMPFEKTRFFKQIPTVRKKVYEREQSQKFLETVKNKTNLIENKIDKN